MREWFTVVDAANGFPQDDVLALSHQNAAEEAVQTWLNEAGVEAS